MEYIHTIKKYTVFLSTEESLDRFHIYQIRCQKNNIKPN